MGGLKDPNCDGFRSGLGRIEGYYERGKSRGLHRM